MPPGSRTCLLGACKEGNCSTEGDHNGVGRLGRPANQTIRGMVKDKRCLVYHLIVSTPSAIGTPLPAPPRLRRDPVAGRPRP
jgi:hypothetical protein